VRTCRNCGLPIASATDPIRGVSAGHVDMPSAQRSGLSATVGLVLVVGLLLVAGTLAVSGGGILSTGGRLGVNPAQSASPDPAASGEPTTVVGPITPGASGDPGTDGSAAAIGTSFAFTCDEGAIKDASRGKWLLERFTAGNRAEDGYDRVTFTLVRTGKKKAANATTVKMEWMTPSEAKSTYGAPRRVQGDNAIVLTFDGPVGINVNQTLDQLHLEPEGVDQIRSIQSFEGNDGKTHAVIGLRGDSCARMSVKGKAWNKKSPQKNAQIWLEIERF
jgi:hypothetical protein